MTVAQRGRGEPFLPRAASSSGSRRTIEWFLATGQGDALSRGVFQVFEPHAPEPRWALKFARVPDYAEPFDRDERGLDSHTMWEARSPSTRRSSSAGSSWRDPRVAQVRGRRSAAARLSPHRRAAQTKAPRAIEAVAEWTLSVARDTRVAAPDRLESERDRLRITCCRTGRTRRPTWQTSWPRSPRCSSTVTSAAGTLSSPAASRCSTGRMLDAGDAPPLWDLWCLLADALAHLDG